MKQKKKTVFVGLSGGVDSAVSAALLKDAGYEVVGVFIKTWHPDFLVCKEEDERRDAMRVAAHLDIPFLTFDFEEVYKKEVGEYMINEYRKGRTPNPDVMCNKYVKFGAFLNKAISMGADYVATGHYAQVAKQGNTFLSGDDAKQNIPEKKNSFALRQKIREDSIVFSQRDKLGGPKENTILSSLVKSIDPLKDQSYFLWTLKQDQLSKILFPIGHLKKTEVRVFAEKYKLPVSNKKDSQGICFLGMVDLKNFLKHYIKEKKGNVLNTKGEIIGYHNGAVFYTLGERHGFTITEKGTNDDRYYVVEKDIKKNILVVSQNKNKEKKNFGQNEIYLENTNWINENPEEEKMYTGQIRYHGTLLSCKIICKNKSLAKVVFTNPVVVAPGQSCVFFNGDICLGGGVVK